MVNKMLAYVACSTLVLGVRPFVVLAANEPQPPAGILQAKTLFQTNSSYDPRLAIAVDAVVVHQHGADPKSLGASLTSWKDKGFAVGRMFFADSDGINEYWTGKWDGTPHPDEVERDSRNEVVQCAGIRPYMLPTQGWTRYLQEMAVESIDAGAQAIFPEEPLAHVHTGYEERFRTLWQKHYNRPWEPESASPQARFLTAQLKNQLYLELERQLGQTIKDQARKAQREIPFVFPVHSLYSNLASHLVAPLGTSLAIDQTDGYIGQVWTGPVNWALANYNSPDKSFFASAYVLYDYFVALTRGSGKKLWLLTDPVEDDPKHTWSEFEKWYGHCVAAELLFPDADAFEVMPWPDRIFLPGHQTGGSTPAPERFRIITLSIVQVQQEIPKGGQWQHEPGQQPTTDLGIAVADTLLWQRHEPPLLQGIYGLFLPLVQRGVPVSACILERATSPGYLNAFRAIILCYEEMKPLDPKVHKALADWVKQGGSLIILGQPDALQDESFWWTKLGLRDPLPHLIAELGINAPYEFDQPVGQGWVLRRSVSPRTFADPKVAQTQYFPLVDRALRKAGAGDPLATPGYFHMRRGPFIIAHALAKPLQLTGPLVDVFDPNLPVLDTVKLTPGSSGLYRDVSEIMRQDTSGKGQPRVLHATHRLMSEKLADNVTRVVVRGPAETPAVVRVYAAGRKPKSITAQDTSNKQLDVSSHEDPATLLLRFPNAPAGVTLTIEWGRR